MFMESFHNILRCNDIYITNVAYMTRKSFIWFDNLQHLELDENSREEDNKGDYE